ncbi:MAG: GNAT family N-acetyltransferase [Planctomycetota bacterium]
MSRQWIAEKPALWDEGKERIVGNAAGGVFDRRFKSLKRGELVPGEWWRVEEQGEAVGYGWLDVVWGDAEILLATAPDRYGQGIGSFILTHLEQEARARGLNRLYNIVRPTHPERGKVTRWLEAHGFRASADGSLMREVPR